ncbi:MAG: sugar kinase, partial [Maribacter sp.]|nr:sugar kinase [Maribacter sp.]
IFASNLSVLETKVAFIGKIGRDNFSDLITSSLENKNVNTDLIIHSDHYKTGLTIVMNYHMDRANVTFPGAMGYLFEKDITSNILNRARHLHLSSIFLQTGLMKDVVKLFQKAKKLGLSTSLDPQWDPSEKWDIDLLGLLSYVDIFLPNVKELCRMTSSEDIASSLNKIRPYANIVVIKDGDRGALLWDTNELISKPAYLNNNVVDCIGAGDSFNAGFISQFLKGSALERCLQFGLIAGAINTTSFGGTSAFSDIEEVKKTAKNKFSFDFK